MKRMTLVLLAALSLSGCDIAKDMAVRVGTEFAKLSPDTERMTIVFWPYTKFMIGGKPAMVVGNEICPPVTTFFGDVDPAVGKPLCTFVTPETKSVLVQVLLPESLSVEVWSVERSDDRTVLRRADGSLIGAAPQTDEGES
jgi:hypothetical protein